MAWFYAETALKPGKASIEGDEGRHIAQASRKRVGDMVTLFDGDGHVADAEIAAAAKHGVEVEVRAVRRLEKPRGPEMTLAVGMVSADSISEALHSVTPLGIAEFVPVVIERSQWGRRTEDGERLKERLERVAIAGCKQSECPYVPKVSRMVRLDEVLSCRWDHMVIASLGCGARDALEVFQSMRDTRLKKLLLLVGPEGGFTDKEHEAATAKGAVGVRIGPYVLRTEHAACVLAALARNTFGW